MTDRQTLVIQIWVSGRYFLKREWNEPEGHQQSDFKVLKSHPLACTYAQLPCERTSLYVWRPFLCCQGRACIKLWQPLHIGALPGNTKGHSVGFLSENVYHWTIAMHGGGETDTKELPEAALGGKLKLTCGQGSGICCCENLSKSSCGRGWAGMLRAPWILLSSPGEKFRLSYTIPYTLEGLCCLESYDFLT